MSSRFNRIVPVILVGAGPMARDYIAVLRSLGYGTQDLQVVTRGEEGARRFTEITGVACRAGGVSQVEVNESTAAIIAVSHDQLAPISMELMKRGCRNLLVEKPGALELSVLEALKLQADQCGASISIAFNRRFFDSVRTAKEIVAEDGGLLSGFFDFTEMEERVMDPGPDGRPPGKAVLARWGIVNSLHVMDLFFSLAGIPEQWEGRVRGSLPWHPAGAIFHGTGVTDRHVVFSYLSTWNGAGRWGIELTTPVHKLILRPMEALVVQKRGSFRMETRCEPESGPLKPGLKQMVEAFLEKREDERCCSLTEGMLHYRVAEMILGYSKKAVGCRL